MYVVYVIDVILDVIFILDVLEVLFLDSDLSHFPRAGAGVWNEKCNASRFTC